MAPIERFEDLVAWQKARCLTSSIYAITRTTAFARDYGLSGQIQRAATSVMSNIAEGFERGTMGEFQHFLLIAKALCAEVRSLLYVAGDVGYLDQTQFTDLLSQAEEVGRVVGGLRVAVERKRDYQREKR